MHSKLLHEALQKEETRAIVIEVDEGPEEPGEDEEFYAANLELLGQEDEDEEGGMISEDFSSSEGIGPFISLVSRYETVVIFNVQ